MASEFYRKRIEATFHQPDQEFFVFTRFFPSKVDNDIETGSIHVELTNGHDYWRSEVYVRADDLSTTKGSGRIRPALEALSNKFKDSTRKFKYEILDTTDELYLAIYFTSGTAAARSRLRIHLHSDPDPQTSIATAISSLFENQNRLKKVVAKLAQERQKLEVIARENRAMVEHLVATAEKSDMALFSGVAAMLNAKKAQIRKAAGREEEHEQGIVELQEEEIPEEDEKERTTESAMSVEEAAGGCKKGRGSLPWWKFSKEISKWCTTAIAEEMN